MTVVYHSEAPLNLPVLSVVEVSKGQYDLKHLLDAVASPPQQTTTGTSLI